MLLVSSDLTCRGLQWQLRGAYVNDERFHLCVNGLVYYAPEGPSASD